MPFDEYSANPWLTRGVVAYQAQRFTEAAEHFEKSVAIDPESVQAHLALGATRLTLYTRRPSPPSPDYLSAWRDVSESELRAYIETEKVILTEQNSTNWALAETSLKHANELAPRDSLVIEYISVLHFKWKDPAEASDHLDESKHWSERLAEVSPGHKYANFHCGMILSIKARKLLPNYGQLPALPEPNIASLRTKVGPLLEEASRHLARALEVGGKHTAASHFVDEVTSMQVYLADPEQAARDLRDKANEMFHQSLESQRAGAPPRSSATITFQLSPEALAEERARPFPPNPWSI